MNLKKEIKRNVNFKDYCFFICLLGFIIITLLLIKKSNCSQLAYYIYFIFGVLHIIYSFAIQLIEIIEQDKSFWKDNYFEKHIDIILLIGTIIIFIIRLKSFDFFKIYLQQIKNLQKFLEIEDKDFFLDSLSEKLFENEGNELNMTY